MKKLIGIAILLMYQEAIIGQNLILNPSFEEVNEITNRWSGTFSIFNNRIKDWDSPTQGSPDILFINSLNKMIPKRPNVDLSNHTPRTGKFMVGIKTYGCATNTLHCKEYLQIKLKEPLQAGQKYYFEYWVSPIKTSVKVNSFGLAVGMERFRNISQIALIELSPVSQNKEIISGDSANWNRIAGVFESNDNYSYIIIGNFGDDSSIEFEKESDGLDYGYYLLDDVLLRPLNSIIPPKFEINETIILENIQFEFDETKIQEVSKPQLKELVEYLKSNKNYHVEIMGHTDSKGSLEYNKVLSQNRANSVKAYLIKNGIEDFRINPIGLGSAYSIVANDSEENRNINRRVEIKITEK